MHELDRKDLARAAEVYELAAAEDPDNPNCLRALGSVYEKMRRWPQAVACLRRQIEGTADDWKSAGGAMVERLAALSANAVAPLLVKGPVHEPGVPKIAALAEAIPGPIPGPRRTAHRAWSAARG